MHIPAFALFVGAILFAISESGPGYRSHSIEHIIGKLIQIVIILIIGASVFANVYRLLFAIFAAL